VNACRAAIDWYLLPDRLIAANPLQQPNDGTEGQTDGCPTGQLGKAGIRKVQPVWI